MKINDNLIPDVFSTSEVKTNKKWINGKPIYRKTIYVSSLPNATATDYSHGITNVESIWADMSNSFVKWTDGVVAPLPYVSVGSPGATAVYSSMIELRGINSTKFTIATGFDRSSLSAYITLNYTKTTD